MGTKMPSGLKSKMFNQAHLHHHLGQNRPHQKTITHPHGPSPKALEPSNIFLGGSEGLIGPPLPHLNGKSVPAEELLLFGRQYPYQRTKKINKYG